MRVLKYWILKKFFILNATNTIKVLGSQSTDAFVVSSVSCSKMGGRVFIYGALLSWGLGGRHSLVFKLGLNFFFSSFDTDEFDKLIVRTSPSDPEPSLGYAGIGLSCSGTSLYTEHLSSLSLSLHLYCHYCMSLTLCLLSPPQFVPLPFCFLHFSVLHTFLPHQHRVSNLWLLPNLNSA